MRDFSYDIRDAINDGTLSELVNKCSGDETLAYSYDERPYIILPKAFDSDECIMAVAQASQGHFPYEQPDGEKGYSLANEIPFTSIINERFLTITLVKSGELSSKDDCSWDKGDLLLLSRRYAMDPLKVMLDHVHPHIVPENGPVRTYGPMPSRIFYGDENEIDANVLDGEVARQMKKNDFYKRHGGDYCEIYLRAQIRPWISTSAIILSPGMGAMGIFEVKSEGRVVYHPWTVGISTGKPAH